MTEYPVDGVITWKGLTWDVRTWDGEPGPNAWREDGVYIDDSGYLHLKIQKVSGAWYSSEIDSRNLYSYGVYRCKVENALNNLDPNIVFSMFTYSDDTHELDIEISKWTSDTKELWYSNQPTTFPGYDITDSQAVICQIDWQEDYITYSTWYEDGTLISEYSTTTNIPSVSSYLIFNLWLIDPTSGMADGLDYELIVSEFEIDPTSTPGEQAMIVYVSSLGTDDYTVDGTADDVEINQALTYANTNGTASAPITVYLRGPYTYEISAWLQIGSNTILTGDSTAKLRLKDSASWSQISADQTRPVIGQLVTPLENTEIYGFEIDGNDTGQPPPATRGRLYYVLMWFVTGSNIKVHDMYLHDALSDGLRADTLDGITFYDNRVERMGHEGCFLIRSNDFEIYGNNTLIRTNTAYRLWNTGTGSIHDNVAKPYALTSISGNPGIQIEHSDINYPMQNIEVYGNTLTDCWGEGIWLIEHGTGGQATAKNLYIHDNVITGAGRITTIDYNSGIAIQGWNGARLYNNVIKDCYNAGILVWSTPPVTGGKCYCVGNIINGTKRTLNSTVKTWSGTGVANLYSSSYTLIMSENIVSDNYNSDYYGVTYSNDVPTTVDTYVNPVIRINELDELVDYYIDGYSSYVNGFPIKISGYEIDTDQSIGTDKPPGFDGWVLGDFGSDGTSINLRCWGSDKTEVRKALAAWKTSGRAYVELGGDSEGWQVSGIVRNHSTKRAPDQGDTEDLYRYNIIFYCDSPYEESLLNHIRARKLTYSGETWSSDNCYAGNIIKNPSFEEWTRGVTQTWTSSNPAESVDFTCVGYSPDLAQYCAVAESGTSNGVQISTDAETWTIPTTLPANIDNDWKGLVWGDIIGLEVGEDDPYVMVSSDGYVMVSSDGYVMTSGDTVPTTTQKAGRWVAVSHIGDSDGAMYSDDGDTWVEAVTPDIDLESVCYVKDVDAGVYRYVAVASSGANRVMYSDDGGETWTNVASADDTATWVSVCNSTTINKVVAVASSGEVMYSADYGATWTLGTIADQAWNEVKCAEYLGLYIAISTDGTQQVATSPDGDTWTLKTVPICSTVVTPGGGDISTVSYTTETGIYYTSAAMEYTSANTSLEYTEILPALTDGNIYRIDQVYCQLRTLLAGKIAYLKVTVQADSLYSGVETQLAEWTNNTIVYVPQSLDLALESATAETVTLRIYMKTSDSNYRAAATEIGFTVTTASTTGGEVEYIYNEWSGLVVSEELMTVMAVAQTGTGNRVMHSTDAENWILGESASDDDWQSAAFSFDQLKYVAVGSSGAVMTSEDYGAYALGSWTVVTAGQTRSEIPYEGSVNLCITGDGVTESPGMITQPVYFEAGTTYSLSGYVQKDGAGGKAVIDLYSAGAVVLSLEWTAETDYLQLEDTIKFEIPPSDAVIRVYGDDTPPETTSMYFDKLCLQKLSDFDIDELGADISTSGTVETSPDISIEAMGTLAGSVEGSETAGNTKTNTDATNVGSTTFTTYQLQDFYNYTIAGKSNTKYRVDKVRIKGCVASSGTTCGSKIEVYFGSTLAGTYTFSSTSVLSAYTSHYASPALTSSEGQSVTFKYYLKTSNSSVRAYIRDASSTITEILETPTVNIDAGISVYNTTDPLTVIRLCNKVFPGIKLTINADGTGSMRYSEDFSDSTYQTAVLSRSGDSYSEALHRVSLTGSLVWEFDSLNPVTGIPYVVLDVVSGIPKLEISTDNVLWYECDSNTLTSLTSERITRELDNAANLRLYGKTKFYMRLTPATGTLVISYAYMFSYLITIDAEHPVILPTGTAETFAVSMTNDVPCIITMKYPDKHWTV